MNKKDIMKKIDQLNRHDKFVIYDDINPNHISYVCCDAIDISVDDINFYKTYVKGNLRGLMSKTLFSNYDFSGDVAYLTYYSCNQSVSSFEISLLINELFNNVIEIEKFKRYGEFSVERIENHVIIENKVQNGLFSLLNYLFGTEGNLICEILDDHSNIASLEFVKLFTKKHQLTLLKLSEIIWYLKTHDDLVYIESDVKLPTDYGSFRMLSFVSKISDEYHLAIICGDVDGKENVTTRVHSECFTGDVLKSNRCDCGEQLEIALKTIADKKLGIVFYMKQEGRGIGLLNKLKAYKLQEQGYDTVSANIELGFDADMRDYYFVKHMLKILNVKSINLLSNNTDKYIKLTEYGVKINDVFDIEVEPKKDNEFYLRTKKLKMGHILKKV